MWHRQNNPEADEPYCPGDGSKTAEDVPVEIYWCRECTVPIIHSTTAADKGVCPNCGRNTRYLSKDLRPVFPEERLLLAFLLGKEPSEYMNRSVWAVNSRYYIDGKPVSIPSKMFAEADTDSIAERINLYSDQIDYSFFNANIKEFVRANQHRLAFLRDEAFSFVRQAAEKYKEESIIISFSGGKDSTATADIVTKALSNPSLVHIFGNTTLEFPATIEYANRYRKDHPKAIFQIAKNDEQVFYDVCEDIGPPARLMRWCCSMFKTGPITRIIKNIELVQVDSVGRALALAQGNVDAVFWTRARSEGSVKNRPASMSDEELETLKQEKIANQTDEETAILQKLLGSLPREEYLQRDMPEGTIITAPYYTDLNVLVTLK